ncbi:carboxypeptidase regulatory-like domain-containing protein [Solitalea sp. MAHUQ-68]|uniref:Carboxypeptidase regulatory-like domain-containing protein n=1 Tax=Solitalea agri TaxID=2953739 RepID=A0A9X2F2B4_9SPHI|nr:carboxypeptidase regulatory-like domain-containing protein [Solitalea agri]MCO4293372.1 carboxypeptidase regulatory-like domain-containing protein [Solitalea agri]
MKRIMLGIVALTGLSAGLFAFTAAELSGIKGNIVPSTGASYVWAIMGTDSLKTSVNSGSFEFNNIKPGNYKVVVDAIEPLKDVQFEVSVPENKVINVGDIKLAQ